MTTSVYPIHRAINRPMTFKGLTGQYILLGAGSLIADLLLFIILYCCKVPSWLCIGIALGLGAATLSACSRLSRKYGVYGLQKARVRRQVPEQLSWRSRRLLSTPGFPLLDVTEAGILSKTGDITIGFELIRPAIFTLSPHQYERIHQLWIKALASLPHGSIVRIMDHYFKELWQGDGSEGSFLGQANSQHFNGAYLANHCYVFITLRKSVRLHRSTLLKGSVTPEFTRDPEWLEQFRHQCRQFRTILEDGDLLQLRYLTPAELLGHEDKKGILEQYCWMSTPDDPTISAIDLAENIRIQGKDCVIYSLADAEHLPAQCSPHIRYEALSTPNSYFPIGFASPVGPLLDIDHYYNLYMIIDEPTKTLANLEKRRRRLTSLSGQSKENAVAAEAIDQFLRTAADGQHRPVHVHANIMARASEIQTAEELRQKISTAITRIGAVPCLETVGAPLLFWAGIPGNAGELPMTDTFITFSEQAGCFVSVETYDQGSNSSYGIRLNERYTGRPINVDLSDEPLRKNQIGNRNKSVTAPSGGGKTYFMLLMVWQMVQLRAHVFLLDIGGSYKRLCELLGGLYLAYTEQDPICFNPFRLDEDESPDIEKKESLLTLLLALWKRSGETYLRSEYVALSNALQGYYRYLTTNATVTACFDTFYEYLRDVYTDILLADKVGREEFDISNFLYVLRPYYQGGEYDYLLNAVHQRSLLHEQLVVLELDNIKDHPILFPVVTLLFMESFISKMRKLKGIRKVIIIEEAWKAIAKEGMAEFLKYLFKTVRKFFGEAIIVTQDIEDIVSSPIVKNAILNNTDCKILLDHSKFSGRFQDIKTAYGLSDHDEAMVMSLNKANHPARPCKEAFVKLANGPGKVYRIEVSLEEHLTFTTEEKERVVVERYACEHGSIQKGIAALAAAIRSGAVKFLLAFAFTGLLTVIPTSHSSAQVVEIAQLIIDAAKKVIMAADLEVQRLQTETIALQNAEKELENDMAGDLLGNITDWVQDQEGLFQQYYQELWQVKSALSTYSRTATLIQRQVALVREEQQDWAAVQKDPHFSAAELSHIGTVYSSILSESSRNIQQIQQVITAFVTQMDDASRLRLIDETSKGIDGNQQDLRAFTQQNALLSLQRAKDEGDILTIQSLYNIP